MQKFTTVTKNNEKSKNLEAKIYTDLIQDGWEANDQHPDIVIFIGGDGTLLYAVQKYLDLLDEVNFVGIHTGTLGFFTDYTEEEYPVFLKDMKERAPKIFCSKLLQIKTNKEEYYALNEMRIENVKRTQVIDVYVDNELFETCWGSGVCLSTQAGSTAYNRSLGGAVIDSGISLMQMAEITAIQHSKHRSLGNPYILKPDRIVEFKSDDFSDALLCFDHRNVSLEGVDKVTCTTSNHSVRFARYREYSYLKRLKNLY